MWRPVLWKPVVVPTAVAVDPTAVGVDATAVAELLHPSVAPDGPDSTCTSIAGDTVATSLADADADPTAVAAN